MRSVSQCGQGTRMFECTWYTSSFIGSMYLSASSTNSASSLVETVLPLGLSIGLLRSCTFLSLRLPQGSIFFPVSHQLVIPRARDRVLTVAGTSLLPMDVTMELAAETHVVLKLNAYRHQHWKFSTVFFSFQSTSEHRTLGGFLAMAS